MTSATTRRSDASVARISRFELVAPAMGAGVAPSALSPRSMRARSAPGRERTTICGVSGGAGAQEPVGPDVGHPPVGLERADDADDAEPRLAARLELHGEGPAEAEVQRVGEAEPTSASSGAATRRPDASGGSSKTV